MASTIKRKSVFIIPLATAVVSVTIFLIAVANKWLGEPAGRGAGFCEAPHDGMIVQPVNTWSNLGFIFTGILIGYLLSIGKYEKNKNPLTQNDFYAIFFATLTVLLGPGSMAMHATSTAVGGFLDLFSMFLVAAFITAYAVERFFNLKPFYFLVVFALIMAICLYVHTLPYKIPVFQFTGSFIFAIFIFVGVMIEVLNTFIRKLNHEIKWGIYSVSIMLLAFLIWNLSLTNSPFCDPSSLVQGHGIWHLLNALSIYFLFRYYVSEHKG